MLATNKRPSGAPPRGLRPRKQCARVLRQVERRLLGEEHGQQLRAPSSSTLFSSQALIPFDHSLGPGVASEAGLVAFGVIGASSSSSASSGRHGATHAGYPDHAHDDTPYSSASSIGRQLLQSAGIENGNPDDDFGLGFVFPDVHYSTGLLLLTPRGRDIGRWITGIIALHIFSAEFWGKEHYMCVAGGLRGCREFFGFGILGKRGLCNLEFRVHALSISTCACMCVCVVQQADGPAHRGRGCGGAGRGAGGGATGMRMPAPHDSGVALQGLLGLPAAAGHKQWEGSAAERQRQRPRVGGHGTGPASRHSG